MRTILPAITLALSFTSTAHSADNPRQIRCEAKETVSAVELDPGDTLAFTLRDGQTRTLVLEQTDAEILLTNVPKIKQGFGGGGTLYRFTARVRIDGHPITLERYVPVQESFYVPYVVNGMRLWFDGVRRIGDLFNENHGDCIPRRQARFAVQDATLPICPQEIRPWYPNPTNTLDVHEAYNGEDVWMGTYFGADLHGGLDVNMPIGTPLWAPIDFDDQFFFNSLKMGHNNNRWRGIRRWPNGDIWTLQAHHIVHLTVPENRPLEQGTHYAVAAGVLTGSHAHSHFVFKTGEGEEEILLDPWILFWQIFENNKRRASELWAEMAPLDPAETGTPVAFKSLSMPGPLGNALSRCWTFGDGGFSTGQQATHTFAKPGIYPVTLVVDDGVHRGTVTQHVTVDGPPVKSPILLIAAPDEVTFRRRPAHIMDVYGRPVRFIPHTIRFVARPRSRPEPAPKTVVLENPGGSALAEAKITVDYHENPGWLNVSSQGSGNRQTLSVSVNASNLRPKDGRYHAIVTVDCPGAVNSPQSFRVQLTTPRYPPPSDTIVDNRDPECYATPYFWLAPRFHGPWPNGYAETYLTNCGRALDGRFVRFTPDLAEGRYELSFVPETRFRPSPLLPKDVRFPVLVRHSNGTATIEAKPLDSLMIGTFHFDEGTDGYVEIHAADSHGHVVADAIRFRRLAN